jgi:aspartyl-tRNA(Asn)/glutamyl-tRNA(Gln) amidotransferase subunit B
MVQVSDTDYLVQLVERAIDENPDTLEKYRAGKTAVLGFLVGQVMKYSQGKANPERVRVLLLERLGSTDTLAR